MGTAVAYLVSGNLRGVSEGDSEIDNMNMEKDENVAEDLNAEKESFIQYYSTLSKIWYSNYVFLCCFCALILYFLKLLTYTIEPFPLGKILNFD